MRKKCVFILAIIFACITAGKAQSSFLPVAKWMAIGKMAVSGNKIRCVFIRAADGTVKYMDMLGNLQTFGGITGVKQLVSGGYDFVVALREDGTVWTWGENESGQLGNSQLVAKSGRIFSFTDSNTPVPVDGLSGVIAVSAYNSTAYALKGDGTLWAWGNARSGLTGNGKRVMHRSESAEAGYVVTPEQVKGITDAVDVSGPMALMSNGAVMTWGENSYGQLGNKDAVSSSIPLRVANLGAVTAVCSNRHGMRMVLKPDGTVWSWGENGHGKLGIGKSDSYPDQVRYIEIPQKVKGLTSALLLCAGQTTNLALCKDGTVKGWGDGRLGSLGAKRETVASPVMIPGIKNAVGVYSGIYNGFALLSDGTLVGWGDGIPVRESMKTAYSVVKIASLGQNAPH